ncbi:MAG: DMT family transporter [Proteobacteria bacterium]|nr:DMT family transporter [Pseudomonadota bacterium]
MSSTGKGALLSICSAFFAALFLIPYKAASEQAERDAVVLAMLLCAAVFNTFTSVSRKRRARTWNRVTLISAVSLAILSIIGNIAVTEALAKIDAGLTSVLQRSQVLFVAGAAYLVLRERITARFVVGALIAIGGFAVMQLPDPGEMRAAGMVWALSSAVCFALMQVVTRKVIHRIDPVRVNALRLWLAVFFLACVTGPIDALSGLDLKIWLLCSSAAFFGPFLGRVSLMYAVRYLPASQSTLLELVSPVFAFVLGFIAFGSVPSITEIAGAAILLAGIVLPVAEFAAQGESRQDRGET